MRITKKKEKPGLLTFFSKVVTLEGSRFVPVMSLARVNFGIVFSAMGLESQTGLKQLSMHVCKINLIGLPKWH